jgi:hypothetical protein
MATLICLKRVLIGKVKRNVAHNIVPSLHALATLGCVTKDHLYFFCCVTQGGQRQVNSQLSRSEKRFLYALVKS